MVSSFKMSCNLSQYVELALLTFRAGGAKGWNNVMLYDSADFHAHIISDLFDNIIN